ncbi:hypothetical protein K3495_g2397 [Podosphaera aphanis]|nr:hypothetical protein K3495_g2397 [Podosphaera aphanis]
MDDLPSSPDPLNDNTLLFSTKIKRSSHARHSSFPKSSTPKKRTFQLDVGNETSPHRIRVTVQAEDSDFDNGYPRMNSIPLSPSRQAARKREKNSARKNSKNDRFDSKGNTPLNITPKSGTVQQKKSVITTSTKKRGRTPNKKIKSSLSSEYYERNDQDDDGEIAIPNENDAESAKRVRSSLKAANEASQTNSSAKKPEYRTKMLSGSKARRGKNGRKSNQFPAASSESKSANFEFDTALNTHEADENRSRTSSINNTSYTPGSLMNQVSDIMSEHNTKIGSLDEEYKNLDHTEQSNSHGITELSKFSSPNWPNTLSNENLEGVDTQVEKEQFDKSTGSKERSNDEISYSRANLTEEPREFDSILESEGFSLISADSIISLKENIKKTKEKIDQNITRIKNPERRSLLDSNPKQSYRTSGLKISNGTMEALPHNDSHTQDSRTDFFASERISDADGELSPDPQLRNSQSFSQNGDRENDSFSSITPKTFPEAPPSRALSNEHDETVISRSFEIDENSSLATSTPMYQRETENLEDNLKVSKIQSYSYSDQNRYLPANLSLEKRGTPKKQPPKYEFLSRNHKAFNNRPSKDSSTYSFVSRHNNSSPPDLVPQEDLAYLESGKCRESDTYIDRIKSILSPSPSFPLLVNSRRGDSYLSSQMSDRNDIEQKAIISSSSTVRHDKLETFLTNQSVERGSEEERGNNSNPISTLNHNMYFSDSPSQTPSRGFSQERKQRNGLQSAIEHSSPLSWVQESTINPSRGRSGNEDDKFGASSSRNLNHISPKFKTAGVSLEQQCIDDRDADFRESKNFDSSKANFIHSSESDEDEDFELLLETLNHASDASPRRQESEITGDRPTGSSISHSAGDKYTKGIIQEERPINLESFLSSNVNESSETAHRGDFTPNVFDQSESKESKGDHNLDDLNSATLEPGNTIDSTLSRDHFAPSIVHILSRQSSPVVPANYYNSSLIEFGSSISSPRLNLRNENTDSDRQDHISDSRVRETTLDTRSEVDSSPRERPTTPSSSKFEKSIPNAPLIDTSTSISQIAAGTQNSPPISHHNTPSSPPLDASESEESRSSPLSESITNPPHPLRSPTHVSPIASAISPVKSCLLRPKTPVKDSSPALLRPTPSKAVTFVSSSPIAASPLAHPLSPTTWTRNHWLALAKIVHHWNPRRSPTRTSPSRPRNSTRVISKLLGRTVTRPHGETMRLEQWHLEAIDEFRSLVPGWEEKAVAKRVFALVVGERIRAKQRLKSETMR